MAANEIIWFGDSLVTLYHTIPEINDDPSTQMMTDVQQKKQQRKLKENK